MSGLTDKLTKSIRSISGDGLAYVTRGYLIEIRDELEQLALPSSVDENQVNVEDVDAFISDLYSDGEGRLGERQIEQLIRYILTEAKKKDEGHKLDMTAKEAIMLHQLYVIGADIVLAIIDPSTIADATGFIAQHMTQEELHAIRDKMAGP